jgi:hypothetical protein
VAVDINQVINTIAAGGICACAAILFKISVELAGFREWRKFVDATLKAHGAELRKLRDDE